ncbi:hypothetical protein I6N90_02665 [Paenibacillus sp. GSMTC-2017]|uniref:hypothetical protein n=1 Tax=Paenibacillus sp. GSMTC-2017 TaxID=2794350 RepID=UPI0018DA1759|nr:hypothetical protein [Paenibacillus sp. GSMTC-2017]MBH5316711.1 hypothetical protein [Paenibacillus sp. GSMTC-2017]
MINSKLKNRWKIDIKPTKELCEALKEIEVGEEMVWWNGSEPFIITRATDDDIERIGRGVFCLD